MAHKYTFTPEAIDTYRAIRDSKPLTKAEAADLKVRAAALMAEREAIIEDFMKVAGSAAKLDCCMSRENWMRYLWLGNGGTDVAVRRINRRTIPEVGDGATLNGWTDSMACTVVKVSKSGKKVTLRRDKATLLNGPNSGEADAIVFHTGGFAAHVTGTQRYAYEADPEGAEYTVTYRDKLGAYKRSGIGVRESGGSAIMGTRSEHYDYNF